MAGTETHPMTSLQLAFKQAGFEVPNFVPSELIRVRPSATSTVPSMTVDPLADILSTETHEAAPAADWKIIEVQKEAPALDWTIIEDFQVEATADKPKRAKREKPKKEDQKPKKIKLSKEEADLLRRREARKNRESYEPKILLELDGFTALATVDDAANLSVLYQANENWSWLAEPVPAIEISGSEQSFQKFLMSERRLAGQYKKTCNEQINGDGEKQFRRICRCCFLKSFKAQEAAKAARRKGFERGMSKEQRDLLYGKTPEIIMVPGYFIDGHEFLCSSCKGMKRGNAKSRLCYPHQWQIGKLHDIADKLRISSEKYSNKDALAEVVFSKMKELAEKPKGKKNEEFNLKTWLVKAESQIDRLRRDLIGKPARNRNLHQTKETQKTAPAVDWAIVKSEAPASELDWIVV